MPAPRSVDDFAEFLTAAYQPLLSALARAGLCGSIEAGPVGHYLLVDRDPSAPEADRVEVTSAGHPLPADPADVDVWLLTSPHTQVVLPGTAPVADLVAATLRLLG